MGKEATKRKRHAKTLWNHLKKYNQSPVEALLPSELMKAQVEVALMKMKGR